MKDLQTRIAPPQPKLTRMISRISQRCLLFLLFGLCLCDTTTIAAENNGGESPGHWYRSGEQAVANNARVIQQSLHNAATPAKNIILFIGDGMGISTVSAARIYAGQQQGTSGEENFLSFERFPYTALAKTYNTNQQTPDSAGTMTAIMTGVKTKAGLIAVNQHTVRGDCRSQQGNELTTALELAEMAGMSTGIVTTTRLTHATPAATYAHSMDRDYESDADATRFSHAGDCEDIASQLVNFPERFASSHPQVNGLEVALGGGRKQFLPRSSNRDGSNRDGTQTDLASGVRLDQKNLPETWKARYPNARYVETKAELQAVDISETSHLLGLFSDSHMAYNADHSIAHPEQPSLSDMTAIAIDVLQKNPRGFFLHIEAGRIDHAHHATNPYRALDDTVALANAVALAQRKTNPRETLIIVTADHSHVFTMGGYPTRGNPILGKVVGNDLSGVPQMQPALASDGKTYTTLGYVNGPGPITGTTTREGIAQQQAVRRDLHAIDTTKKNFRADTLVPLPTETHGGEDVAVYATGPGAALVNGVLEQHVIFHIMNRAGQLRQRATAGADSIAPVHANVQGQSKVRVLTTP